MSNHINILCWLFVAFDFSVFSALWLLEVYVCLWTPCSFICNIFINTHTQIVIYKKMKKFIRWRVMKWSYVTEMLCWRKTNISKIFAILSRSRQILESLFLALEHLHSGHSRYAIIRLKIVSVSFSSKNIPCIHYRIRFDCLCMVLHWWLYIIDSRFWIYQSKSGAMISLYNFMERTGEFTQIWCFEIVINVCVPDKIY